MNKQLFFFVILATVFSCFATDVPIESSVTIIANPDSTFSIQASKSRLGNVLSQLAIKSGNQIVIHGECNSLINATVNHARFDSALIALLRASTYTYVVRGDIYIVAEQNVDTLLYTSLITDELLRSIHHGQSADIAHFPDIIGIIPVPLANRDLITDELVLLKHVRAEEIMTALSETIKKTHVSIDKERNALLVNGTSYEISRLKKAITEIDTPRIPKIADAIL